MPVRVPVRVQVVFVGVFLLTKAGSAKQAAAQQQYEQMEEAEEREQKLNVHYNASFEPNRTNPNDPDIPQKNGGLDTLRFTSERRPAAHARVHIHDSQSRGAWAAGRRRHRAHVKPGAS